MGNLQAQCEQAQRRKEKSGGEKSKTHAEAVHFDTFESRLCVAEIGEELPEAMMVQIDEVNETEREVDIWIFTSHQGITARKDRGGKMSATNENSLGVVDVKEWGTVLLEVDGVQGKRIMRLREVLIVPNIKVNLFSLQRVVDIGYIPVFGEKAGK